MYLRFSWVRPCAKGEKSTACYGGVRDAGAQLWIEHRLYQTTLRYLPETKLVTFVSHW